MFVNELEINKILAKSQFASHFPKLIISGYLNGVPSQPMHIFEDLGEELPMSKWEYNKVHETIKLRLEEIHLLGICHDDVRAAIIHVSVTGKVSLIDFGLSIYPCSEEDKKFDFKVLDDIFRVYSHGNQEEEHGNRGDAIIFDKISEKSQSTSFTRDGVTSKG
ncbi:uncharacterized protein PRCAT00001424001 [Priceomyces carsonii]|uniref:uncharacterized protein n=1 Tax=Priceomyces carsonii TaxID=28549 RepID=UPI002ED843EF|nr:unnamed protein product [Priceomyces carsonii]